MSSITAAALMPRAPGANDRIQVGFIGYGLIGAQHVRDFKSQNDVDLAALCDVYQPRLEQGLAACGPRAKGYKDFRRLLDDKDIQAVVISTPDHWHALLTLMACAAGKDVYVEKPMTLFVREGRWMVNAARRHNRIVQVGSQQRSGVHYHNALKRLQDGQIGRIHSVRMGFFRNVMPGFGSPPDSDPPPGMDYDLWLGPAPLRRYNKNRSIYHFRWFWDYSGGQITNLGAHEIDVVQWAMGVNGPGAVGASGGRLALEDNGETPDTQDAIFEYPGFTMVWSHREASRGRGAGSGLEFFGTKGSLTLSRAGYEIFADMKIPPENQIPEFSGHPVGGPVRHPEAKPVPWTDVMNERASNSLLESHVRNFLDCIKSRARPAADVEDGHRTATACHLANISLRLGRKVRWDAAKEEIIGDAEASAYLVRPYRNPWDEVLRKLI
ncbi:MAG TPA: Gfo/Idh/MocA family oxidoreductase [Terriglobia bacterium]|nr:Gfo/Idh/MocA family oxidoreductase [Terriglobia bacterium]